MQYFKNLFNSFTNPDSYSQFIKGKNSTAFWHFAISMLVIGTLQGLYFSTTGLPILREKIDLGLDNVQAGYPVDLEIAWDGSQLTTTPEEYHTIKLDLAELELFDQLPADVSYNQALLYINEDLSFNEAVETMDQENVDGIIDQESFYFSSPESGKVEQYALREALQDTDFTVNKDALPVLRELVNQGVDAGLKFIIWFLPLVLAVATLVSRLMISLVFATLLYIPAKLGKFLADWQQSWRFTLVLLVVVEILSQLASLLYPSLTFPVHSTAFWILSLFILVALKTKPQAKKGKGR